jgi:hypothetical protein
MIIKDGHLVLEVQKEFKELIDQVEKKVQKKFGAIYKGSQLVWLTIYNAVKSCYSSGTWLKEKYWTNGDEWRND